MDLKIHFSKDNTQLANKHIGKKKTSLVNKKIEAKATMRYYFAPSRIWKWKSQSSDSYGIAGAPNSQTILKRKNR